MSAARLSGVPLLRAACVGLALLGLGAAPGPRGHDSGGSGAHDNGSGGNGDHGNGSRGNGYTGRAWLLIGESSRANEFLGQRVRDRELARLIAQAAEARLQAATDTSVPHEVELAHPHLLLMLEHYERAASAAASGKTGAYAEHGSAARDEEQIFRSVLHQLGWSLPAGRP